MYDLIDSGWPFYCIDVGAAWNILTNRNGECEGNAKIERNRWSIEWFFVIGRPQETAKIAMVKTLSVDGGLFPKFQSYFSSIRSFRASEAFEHSWYRVSVSVYRIAFRTYSIETVGGNEKEEKKRAPFTGASFVGTSSDRHRAYLLTHNFQCIL